MLSRPRSPVRWRQGRGRPPNVIFQCNAQALFWGTKTNVLLHGKFAGALSSSIILGTWGQTSRPGCFRSGEERALVAGDAGRRGRERRWSDHPCNAQKFREGLHRAMVLLIRMRPAYPGGHRWNRMPARRYALFTRGRAPSEWSGTESRSECCGGSGTQARGAAWASHLRPFISSRCPSSGGRRALFCMWDRFVCGTAGRWSGHRESRGPMHRLHAWCHRERVPLRTREILRTGDQFERPPLRKL